MCIEFIRRHIRKLAPTQIFTTRDMLIYGARAAVDSALSRMVSTGFIVRLARGIFVQDASPEPSVEEIAAVKAKILCIKLKEFPEKALNDAGIYFSNQFVATFAKTGHSSSFETIHGRVQFKGISGKKMQLLETAVGQVVFALWCWSYRLCEPAHVRRATYWFRRKEKDLLWLFSSLMPAWLTQICRACYPRPRPGGWTDTASGFSSA